MTDIEKALEWADNLICADDGWPHGEVLASSLREWRARAEKAEAERDEARKRVKELEIDHAHEEARHISACHREAMQAHDLLSETRKLVEAEKRVKELEAWKSAAIGQSAGWGGRKPAGP